MRITRTCLAVGAVALALAACRDSTGPTGGSVPNVGDAVTLNTAARGANSACEVPDYRTGRVVAVTERTVVVADNANPSGGFTDAEYAQIAQEFDALVYPVITQNFGAPTDIDENGARSVIFYTRAVNELTPAGGEAVTGGFFHPRDLFPKTSTNPNIFSCATSNEAEVFYMLVPDPSGQVNGNVRTKTAVRRQTVGVLAHEFQHLINGSRRLYVNNAEDFEEVWLNEGLSHIAEELMFYRVSGRAPKQNITLAMLQSSPTSVDAFNAYQLSNFGRLIEYLENPEMRSPYTALTASTDPIEDLAVRGAAWQLLRYAADRSTTPQQQIWMNLANSQVIGIPNVTAVFGGVFLDLVRDWTVAQYTDDAVTTVATFQQPSWHYRSIVPALLDPPSFPLRTRTLTAGVQVSLTLRGGAAAYLRFGVAGGATGRITVTSTGSALPGNDPPVGVLSLAVGETRTLSASQGSTIEVSGGSGGGEFVLIPFHGSQTASDQVALEFTGTQITGVSGPPNPYVAPAGARQLSLGSRTDALTSAGRFDLSLRRLEREVFGPRLAAHRAAAGSGLSPLRSGPAQVSLTVVRTR